MAADNGRAWAQKKETDRIVIWTWDDTFNVKAAKLAAKEYKKTHKDIQIIVETKEREEILADTKNLIASKMYQELPDVIMIEDYDIQDVLSQYEDEFVDLTDKVDYDRYTDYKSKLCSKETDFMESRLTAEQQHFFTGSIF